MTATAETSHDLWRYLSEYEIAVVALEVFATGGRVDAHMIHTMEIVGSVKGICYVKKIPCVFQQPQMRRSFISDAKAILEEQLGRPVRMNKQDGEDHEVDALAHVLCLEYRIKRGEVKL